MNTACRVRLLTCFAFVLATKPWSFDMPKGPLNDSIIRSSCTQQFANDSTNFEWCLQFLEDVKEVNEDELRRYRALVKPILDSLALYLNRPEVFTYFPRHTIPFEEVKAKVNMIRTSLRGYVKPFKTRALLDQAEYILLIGRAYDLFQFLLTKSVPKVPAEDLKRDSVYFRVKDKAVLTDTTDLEVYYAFLTSICFTKGAPDYQEFLGLIQNRCHLLVHSQLCDFDFSSSSSKNDSIVLKHILPILNACESTERRIVSQWDYDYVLDDVSYYICSAFRSLTHDSAITDSIQRERSLRFLRSPQVVMFVEQFDQTIFLHESKSSLAPRCIEFIRELNGLKNRPGMRRND